MMKSTITADITGTPSWFLDEELVDELKRQLPGLTWTKGTRVASDSIVAAFLRPCVRRGQNPASAFWGRRLQIADLDIGQAFAVSGLIEVVGFPGLRFAGAGWMAGKNALVTAGHVADICRLAASSVVHFTDGQAFPVMKVVSDAESGLAFLLFKEGKKGPGPFPLLVDELAAPYVAAVGFPFEDSRAEPSVGSPVYNEFCVAPGRVSNEGNRLSHDCGMPDNSAGSMILDLESGRAAGLHLGGGAAVPAAQIAGALERQGIEGWVDNLESLELEAVKLTPADYKTRKGYDLKFLGIPVPLPKPVGPYSKDSSGPLPYTHFSVAMSISRKLCFYAAVNIDGNQVKSLRRADKADRWLFDPRLERSEQCGREIYRGGYLDLGHMVRRLDPVWGKEFEAANDDTFHYTNACPQHKDLNRKIWNDLEDYLLQNTGENDLKVTVFTGPVLGKGDAPYRGIQLPQEYWKVAVMVDPDTGKLHATGYLLSQKDMVTGLEFLFGAYRTYQVSIERIEKLTNLDFGKLRQFDPKKKAKASTKVVHEINGPGDLET